MMGQNKFTEKVFVIKLINGIEINKKHPTTFLIPSEDFINKNLKVGSIVKIGDIDYHERFWVCVLDFIDENTMICEIRNELYNNQPYDYLDKVIVRRENIIGYEIFKNNDEIEEIVNEEIFLRTENKWKDWDYDKLISDLKYFNNN